MMLMDESVGSLVHLPCGSPMKLDASAVRLFSDAVKEIGESEIKERLEIFFGSSVSVKLDKDIVADLRGQIKPPVRASRSRQIVTGEFASFDTRKQPFTKANPERAGDHEQIALPAASDFGLDTAIEGAGPVIGIAGAPIDLIYHATLCRGRHRGQRKIRITTEIAQESDFSVQSAKRAARKRVIQSPIAMNEAEDDAAVLFAQETVVAMKPATILGDFLDERFALFILVVKMNLDVSDAQANYFSDDVEQFAPILFLRIEEAVLGALARGIARSVVRDTRPLFAP